MERVVFVEVLGRRGDVQHRVRLAALPATIGRAWTNDVILSDPHVDPQHARIQVNEAGELELEDLGSVNGVQIDGRPARAPRIALGSMATVRVGRTSLRIATADQPVPAAIKDSEPSGVLAGLLTSTRAMVVLLALGLAASSLVVWLSDYQGKSGGTLAGRVVGIVAAAVGWAGLWALAGRLIIHRARFWQHLTLTSLVFLVLWVIGVACSWAAFLFLPELVTDFEASVATALFVAALVLHAGLASNASLKRRLLFGIGLTVGLGLLAWVGEKSTSDDYGGTVAITSSLKPVPASLIPAASLDGFVSNLDTVKRAIDRKDDDER